jgi:hypothetical protein
MKSPAKKKTKKRLMTKAQRARRQSRALRALAVKEHERRRAALADVVFGELGGRGAPTGADDYIIPLNWQRAIGAGGDERGPGLLTPTTYLRHCWVRLKRRTLDTYAANSPTGPKSCHGPQVWRTDDSVGSPLGA